METDDLHAIKLVAVDSVKPLEELALESPYFIFKLKFIRSKSLQKCRRFKHNKESFAS